MASNDDHDSGAGSGSASTWSASLKGLRSIFPGYGSKSDEDNTVIDPDPSSHQVTDYQEGERRDINNGKVIKLEESRQQKQTEPEPEAERERAPETTTALPQREEPAVMTTDQGQPVNDTPNTKDHPIVTTPNTANMTTIPPPSLSPPSLPPSKVERVSSKVMTSISSTTSKRKRNLVLPDYYEQFSDAQPSLLLTVPVGSTDLALVGQEGKRGVTSSTNTTFSGRIYSSMKSLFSSMGSMLFRTGATDPSVPKNTIPQRGTQGIRKVVIIGVHGWFPRKALWTVIGEPTGTSQKFCEEMDLALKEYLEKHGKHLDSDDVTLIPLEGEGKVLDRVEILHKKFINHQKWRHAVHEADLVLVATHSQGTPTSILLIAKWIKEGILRVQEDDPRIQRIGILAMAGISHGPFPFLKGNLIVRWF
ncbi:hypothetical protein BCR41DRAFT_366334, partial [Lobosporangium transversale]